MSRTPWRLVFRHLRVHWLRTALLLGAVALASFLLVVLGSLVTSLERASAQAASNRVIVQSAVSLFVDLPRDYQPKIAAVPGVRLVSKWQWFGGIYQDPKNFFAQFGIDADVFFTQYAHDIDIIAALDAPAGAPPEALVLRAREAILADRRAAIVGEELARRYGFKVGDAVPLLGAIFPRADGQAWEFNVVGIYRPKRANFDAQTMFFRYDYLAETVDAGLALGPPGVGTYAVTVADGQDPAAVIAGIDGLFASGPQKTSTTTEAAFQAGFASMLGNVPMFVSTIGGAVAFAVFFSVVNVMLLSARQRVHEAGILKALGFGDGVLLRLVLGEALFLSLLGGTLGMVLAALASAGIGRGLAGFIPAFAIEPSTYAAGGLAALAVGLVAGIGPALGLARLRPTQALASEG